MTPNPTPLQALQVAVRNGRYDDKLDLVIDRVFKTIKARRSHLSDQAAKNFVSGSHVRIKKGNYKPKYFHGLTGTVESFDNRRIWVVLDKPVVRKKRTISKVGVQAIYLEDIE